MNITQISESLFALIFLWVISGVATYLLLHPIRKFAIKQGFIDRPNIARKQQLEPVPYLGGVGIALTVTCIGAIGVLLEKQSKFLFPIFGAILFPAFLMLILGLIDDLNSLTARVKLSFQIIAGVISAGILIITNTIGKSFGSDLLNFVISIIWIVGITNSINLIDNSDGISGGVVAISALTLGVLSFQGGQFYIGGLSFLISGATLGFLVWNVPPARIYLGDSGALFLGLMMAVITIRIAPENLTLIYSIFVVWLVMFIPILDTSLVFSSRISKGMSPFEGGRDHLAHRLKRIGHDSRRTGFIIWSLTGFFNFNAI
jgi:UDP-GlcNAc:undecaprenyl-phosphate GlcNAc-1-phosphate transferase